MTPPPRRRKWLRRILLGLGGFALLLFGLWLFRFPLFGGLMKRAIAGALEAEGIRLEVREISGTLLTDAEVRGIRVVDSTGLPMIRAASVERVYARVSLFGLLTGRDDWIRVAEIEGLSVVLDLDAAGPEPGEPEPPAESGGGATPLPGRVRISGLDVTLLSGSDELVLAGAFLSADRGEGFSYRGAFGADEARLSVEGENRRAVEIRGEFSWQDDVLTVEPWRMNGTDHGQVLRADLSKAAENRIEARLDLPILAGRIGVDAVADLSGADPRGHARVEFRGVRPGPLLRFLPGVPVGLDALDGTAAVTLPESGETTLARIAGEFDLRIETPSYEGRRAGSVAVAGTLRDGRIDVRGTVSDPGVSFGGTVDVGADPVVLDARAAIESLDLARADLALEGRPLRGVVRLLATARGPVDALEFTARLEVDRPSLGEYDAGRLSLVAGGTLEEILVSSLVVARGEDEISLDTTTVRPGAEPLSFAGRAVIRLGGVEPYRAWLPAGLPADLAGKLRVTASFDGTIDAPGAEVTVDGTGLKAEGLALRTLHLEAGIPALDRFLVRILRLEGEGDLPDVTLADAEVSLGVGRTEVRIGSLAARRDAIEVASSAPLTLVLSDDGIEFRGPLAGTGLGLTIDASVGKGDALTGTVVFHETDLARVSELAGLPVGLSGLLDGTVRLGGTTAEPEGRVDLAVPGFAVTIPDRPAIRADRLVLAARLGGGVARLEELSISGGGEDGPWSLRVEGAIPFSLAGPDDPGAAPLRDALVRIRALPLGLAGAVPGLSALRGTLDLDLVLSGTPSTPAATGSVSLAIPVLALEDPAMPELRDVRVRLRAEGLSAAGGRVSVEELAAGFPGGRLEARGSAAHRDGAPEDLRLHLEVLDVDLETALTAFTGGAPATGSASVTVDLEAGPVIRVKVAGLNLRASGLELGRFDLAAAWENGVLTIGSGALAGPQARLEFGGSAPVDLDLAAFTAGVRPDAAPAVFARPDLDLATLDLRESGVRLSGRVTGEIRTSGTYAEPAVTGSLVLSHLFARVAGAPAVDDFGGEIRLEPGRVVIRDLKGRLGGGPLRIDGTVGLAGLAPGEMDLAIDGTDCLLVRERDMLFRGDLQLRLQGVLAEAAKLSGRIRVRTLRYFADVEYLSTQPSLAPLPLTEDPIASTLALDLVVEAPPGSIRVDTNVLTGGLEGRFEIGGTAAVPRPDGRIQVKDGTARLPTADMKIRRGMVSFRRSEPMRPYVEADLVASIGGTEVRTHATGPANGLQIELSSSPPLPKPDILSLLVTGVPRDQFGASAAGSAAATLLYRQISAGMSRRGGEPSAFSKLASRVDVSVDPSPAAGGGPTWTAALRLVDDWLILRAGQDDSTNFGVDLLFRLSFK